MMTKSIREIRKENLKNLVHKYGRVSELANQLDKDRSQISQLIGEKSFRNLGESLAREIEEKLGLGHYWLDTDHKKANINSNAEILLSEAHIPVLDISLSAGDGSIVMQEDAIHKIGLPKWLMRELNVQEDQCCFVGIKGDCMSPTISHDDKVLVDLTKTTVESGSVYSLRLDGEIMIKRLFKEGRDICLACDNQLKYQYPNRVLKNSEVNLRLYIIGKVVYKLGRI